MTTPTQKDALVAARKFIADQHSGYGFCTNPDCSDAKLLAQIDAALSTPEETGWRDIATAPKDGTLVDLWVINHLTFDKRGQRITDKKWGTYKDWMGFEREGFCLTEDLEPTHWMPKPTPPEAEK